LKFQNSFNKPLKHELGKANRDLQEQLSDKDDALAEKNLTIQSLEEQSILKEEKYISEAKQLKKVIDQYKVNLEDKSAQLHDLEKLNEVNKTMINNLTTQAKGAEKDKIQSLKEQKDQLDKVHQQLVDHWMITADSEKQAKDKLSKQTDRLREEEALLHKKILSIEHSHSLKKHEIEVLHTRIADQEEQITNLKKDATLLNQLLMLLENTKEPEKSLQKLLYDSKNYQEVCKKQKMIEKELSEFERTKQDLTSYKNKNIALEHEVIKLQAYIEGMKQK